MTIDWQEIKKWLKDTSKIALKEAEDLSTKGKLRIEIFNLIRKRDKYLINLGLKRYHEYKKRIEYNLDAETKILLENIDKIEHQLKQKKDELNRLK